jgi:hypothetical protein
LLVWLQGKPLDYLPLILIRSERNSFSFGADALELANRAAQDFLPAAPRDEKALVAISDSTGLRSGGDGDGDFRRDSMERDEKRLAELGRKTVEMYAIVHIFNSCLEVSGRVRGGWIVR